MKKAVHESDSYRYSAELSPDGIFVIGLDGVVQYCNPAVRDLTGYEPGVFCRRRIAELEFLSDEDRQTFRKLFRKLVDDQQTDPVEFQITRKDGARRWVEVRGGILRDKNGPFALQTITRDIHEQKVAAQQLSENEARYRFLFDKSFAVNIIIDPDGTILDLNEMAVNLAGYKREEILGRSVFDFIIPEQHEQARHSIQNDLKGQGTNVIRIDLAGREGIRSVLFAPGSAQLMKDGKVGSLLISGIDITSQVQLEAVKEQKGRLERIVAEISARFINYPDEQFDQIFVDGLKQLAEFLGAIRCNFYLFSEDRQHIESKYEWCLDGPDEEDISRRKVPVDPFIYSTSILEKRQNFIINSLSDLPEEAAGEKKWFEKYSFRPIFFVPIHSHGILSGLISFGGATDKAESWPTGLDHLLNLVSEVFYTALERRKINRLYRLTRFAVEHSRQSVILLGPDSRIISANPAVSEMTGYSQEELPGMMIRQFDPDFPPEEFSKFFKAVKAAGNQSFEAKVITRKGTEKPVEINASYFNFEGEELITAFIHDITERIRSQKQIRNRLEIERLVSSLSARFINMPDSKLDEGIRDTLKEIGKFCGASRTSLFLVDESDPSSFTYSHEWSRTKKDAQINKSDSIPYSLFAYYEQTLKQKKALIVRKHADVPADARGEQEWIKKHGFRAMMVVPMIEKGKLSGAVGMYGKLDEETAWPEEYTGLLYFVSDIFINALNRKKITELLRFNQFSIDNAGNPFFWMDKAGRFTYANRATSELTGYSDDELSKMKIFDLTPFKGKQKFQEMWSEVKDKGSLQFQSSITSRDKHSIPVEVNIHYVNFEGQEFLSAFASDITARLEAEEAIRNSEENYRRIFENMVDIFYEANMDGILLNVTPSMESFAKYKREEVIGRPLSQFYANPAEREQVLAVLNKEGFIKDYEVRMRDKDGSIRHGQLSAQIVRDEHGKPARIVGSLKDITLRVQALSQIRKLSAAVEQTPISVIILSVDGQIDYVNPTFEKMIGYPKEELLGHHLTEVKELRFSRQKYEQVRDNLSRHSSWKGEISYLKNQKQEAWAQLTLSTISDSEGSITHFVGIGEDITRRKLYEDSLKLAKQQAEESDQLKSSFLANMSHEIRTPMNAILGFSTLLKDHLLTREQRDYYIDIINNKGKDLIRIISDIIDISRIETGDLMIRREPVQLFGFIEEIYEEFSNDAVISARSNLQFRIRMPEPRKIILNTDAARLKQVIVNLIQNAVKFTPEGYIELGFTFVPGKRVRIYVKDSGIGIPRQKQEVIFDRFRQVDDSHTRQYGGTGLGLSISKNLVAKLGGTLEVVSEPGQGSEFFFTLKYIPTGEVFEKAEKEQEVIPRSVPEKSVNLAGKKIMIVEDDSTSYLFLDSILNKTKPEIVWAKNGKQAVELFEETDDFDLVLMDIRMPEMNGIDATRVIREMNDHIPIIAQTAYAQVTDRKLALESGCNDYISKPINVKELNQLLVKYLD